MKTKKRTVSHFPVGGIFKVKNRNLEILKAQDIDWESLGVVDPPFNGNGLWACLNREDRTVHFAPSIFRAVRGWFEVWT